jgi:hypothetical protein
VRHLVQVTVGCAVAASATLLLGMGTAQAATPATAVHGVAPTLGPPNVGGAEQNLGYAFTDVIIILSSLGL